MKKIGLADLLADMLSVRKALVTRYAWLIHVTPIEALPDIRSHGLEPQSDAPEPLAVKQAIGHGRMVFFHPLGTETAAPPVSRRHEGVLRSGQYATLAIRSACIPDRVGIDWSFNIANPQNLFDSTLANDIDGVVADLVRRSGSCVTYDHVDPAKLRIFSIGDQPTNPMSWKRLIDTRDGYGLFTKEN